MLRGSFEKREDVALLAARDRRVWHGPRAGGFRPLDRVGYGS